jgi:hypothetical protein
MPSTERTAVTPAGSVCADAVASRVRGARHRVRRRISFSMGRGGTVDDDTPV